MVILAAIFAGAILGTLQLRGRPPWQTALLCVVVVLAVIGLDLTMGGGWMVRGLLTVAALGVAWIVKRRSVFKERPEPLERDLLVMGLKTVLMVFGAVSTFSAVSSWRFPGKSGPRLLRQNGFLLARRR